MVQKVDRNLKIIVHQPLAQRYFYSGQADKLECDLYLLIGLRANEVLHVIPFDQDNADEVINKKIRW